MDIVHFFQQVIQLTVANDTDNYELVKQSETHAVLHSNMIRSTLYKEVNLELMDAYKHTFGEECIAIRDRNERYTNDTLYLKLNQHQVMVDLTFYTDEVPYDAFLDLNKWSEGCFYHDALNENELDVHEQRKLTSIIQWMKNWFQDHPSHRLYVATGEVNWSQTEIIDDIWQT